MRRTLILTLALLLSALVLWACGGGVTPAYCDP